MERTRKHLLAAALALAAVLILAVPALAADEEFVEVRTETELIAALNDSEKDIVFTEDITTQSMVNIGSVAINLNGHTWTVKGEGPLVVDPETDDGVHIINGKIENDTDNTVVLRQWSGRLFLSDLVIEGGISGNNINDINSCNIVLDLGDGNGNGAAALQVASGGTIEQIRYSSITAHGQMTRGIYIREDASIGSIDDCVIASDYDASDLGGCSIANSGTIGSITDCDIDGIYGGEIIGGSDLPYGAAIYFHSVDDVDEGRTVGNIGRLHSVKISGIWMNGGEIGAIENCKISTVSGSCPIFVSRGATIGLISGNTITADQNECITNQGTIANLGENTIIGDYVRCGQPSHVFNTMGGNLTVTATGTVQEVEFQFGDGPTMDKVFIADNGDWWVQNAYGMGGTVTAPNATVEEDKALRFTGQIRLIEPWGLRVNVGIPNVEQREIESVEVTFTQGNRTKTVTAKYNADYSQAKGGVWYSADLTGIQTQYLDDSISFTAVVTLADRTTIKTEEPKTVNMVNVLESCAANGAYSREEQNVYKAILDWFTAYQAYLAKN